jgi:hypothetical protein
VLLWLKVAQCYAAIKENAEAICVYYRGNTEAPTLFLQILLIVLFTDPLIFMQCLHLRPKDTCESSICTESCRIHVKTVYSLRATGICESV